MKLCFASSSGGHYAQLLQLRPLMDENDSFIVTEGASDAGVRTYALEQVNRRERGFIPLMLKNTVRSIRILWRERPDAVITTGVLAVVPLCILAKLAGARLIYIESYAKVYTGTLTGRVLYRFADRFYVQWEEMLGVYPGALYKGGIYS